MSSNPTGPDWVLVWAGTIALLRAVGHVLVKEDSTKSDARVKKAQRAWWDTLNATKPNPVYFLGIHRLCCIETGSSRRAELNDRAVSHGVP